MRSEINIASFSRPRFSDGVLLLLLVALTALSPRFLPAGSIGERLTVTAMDSVTEIPLGVDGRHQVSGPLGAAVLVVEKGRAHLENAPCPLKICEAMGAIERSGQVIVCLPNRIVVKVQGPEEVDAVSR